jgi:hypothetical protein
MVGLIFRAISSAGSCVRSPFLPGLRLFAWYLKDLIREGGPMQANVKGRVSNIQLAKSHGLLPLFEAIINSVDAIDEAKREKAGQIRVCILRDENTLTLKTGSDEDDRVLKPVYGFEIEDNGIGFTEANFRAFDEADTRYKELRGGRGVGRFLWLKAFDKVEVESVFRVGQTFSRRAFTFSLAVPEGISEHDVEQNVEATDTRTVVRLLGIKEGYRDSVSKGAATIARHMIEHCLEYFVLGLMPPVVLYDVDGAEPVDLRQYYSELVENSEKSDDVEVKGNRFDIIHFVLKAHPEQGHHLSFCGQKRVVKIEKLTCNKIPNLPTSLTLDGENGKYMYAGYVSSEYLDSRINQQRTDFDTIPEDSLLAQTKEMSWPDLSAAMFQKSKEFLSRFTDKVKAEKTRQVKEFVDTEAPEYRYIVETYPEKLDLIPPGLSAPAVEVKLHEIHRDIEAQLREQGAAFIQNGILGDDEASFEERLDEFWRWCREYNESGKANLARYILHRKLMLGALNEALKRQGTGKFSREELVHSIIFPVRKTSDDITYEQHNLWIIDEKLAYHRYLASDIRMSEMKALANGSISRPDLVPRHYDYDG